MLDEVQAEPATRSWASWALLSAGALCVGMLVFSPGMGAYFVADDLNELGEAVLAPPAGRLSGSDLSFLRPLFRLTLYLENAVFGLDPFPMHISNVLWHCATAVIVVGVVGALRRALPGRSPDRGEPTPAEGRSLSDPVALLAGGLFLVMPNHIEPVLWLAARADLIATAAVLLSLLLWVHGGRRHRHLHTAGSLVAFTLALGAKESAVVLPAVLSLYELCRSWTPSNGVRPFLNRAARPALHWAVLVVYVAMRWAALGHPLSGYGASAFSFDDPPRATRLALSSLLRSSLPALPLGAWLAALLVGVLVLCGAAWHVATRARSLTNLNVSLRQPRVTTVFAALATVVCLVPTASLGVDLDGSAGERTVYLASAFAAWLLAEALIRLVATRRAIGQLVCGALLAVGVAMCVAGAVRWRTVGEVNRTVTAQALRWSSDRSIFVLNMPGWVDGDIAARNVVPGGLQVVRPNAAKVDITVLAYQAMKTPTDWADVRVDQRHDALVVRLRVDRGSLHPEILEGRTSDGDSFAVSSESPQHLSATFGPTVSREQIWLFWNGSLRSLEDVLADG